MKMITAVLLLTLTQFGWCQSVPDEPKPKHEIVKFTAATVFFGGSAVAQVLSQHHGAQLCKIESLRNGVPWTANSPGTGFRPDNADRREAYITGGVWVGSLILELAHHRTAAKRILIFGGTANYGVAGATWWAGCN